MDVDSESKKNLGVAAIKAEFLVPDKAREIDLDFVASKDKKDLTNEEGERNSAEPPHKKLKGQNKHRPRNAKAPKSEKLCFKIGREGSCPFGDSCCYSHDVEKYLDSKPPDISSVCCLFRTFGKCPYSYSCRFASDHVRDGKDVVIEEKWNEFKDRKMTENFLSNGLMFQLRKRSYDFEKSKNAALEFEGTINANKCTSQTQRIAKETDSALQRNGSHSNMKSDDKGNPESTKSTSDIASTSDDDALFCPEIKKIDFSDKLYLAPLTTVGNLPFRRICKELGADVTCSEMTLALSLLQAQKSEWALIKRHHTEDLFGIQLCGSHPDVMTRCCQVLSENASFDFIDLNLGCPLDGIYKQGAGSGLMNRMKKLEGIIFGISSVIDVPLTMKIRTGICANDNIAHHLIEKVKNMKKSVTLITLHGRSREQRYTKSADWEYIERCSKIANPVPLFGNGDILSFEDYSRRRKETSVTGSMIARGALIKPWIFQEIKNENNWDISSSERFDILKKYVNYGLEHWGSDTEGVEKTRKFLLEWLSFLHRYIPVGLLEQPPQKINERPPPYVGRDDLETLMASPSCSDWVKISEMLLGPVPETFVFLPKHKANAYK